ncbi:hypothetical protein [Anaerotruncus rubiinfantis]|uniref:hypothetical protein n=1 Tax=Anaerotruncus rubiinfantis TaxID=1720200 RepID=UPI000833BD49|nr:hypothetical protein [Anaerotruncus rubiinfantis]
MHLGMLAASLFLVCFVLIKPFDSVHLLDDPFFSFRPTFHLHIFGPQYYFKLMGSKNQGFLKIFFETVNPIAQSLRDALVVSFTICHKNFVRLFIQADFYLMDFGAVGWATHLFLFRQWLISLLLAYKNYKRLCAKSRALFAFCAFRRVHNYAPSRRPGPISCSCKKWGKEHAKVASRPFGNPADALPKLAPQVLPTHGQLRAEAGVSRSQRACAHLKSICPLSAQPVFAMVAKTRPARHCEARAAHFVSSEQIARDLCRRQRNRAHGAAGCPRVSFFGSFLGQARKELRAREGRKNSGRAKGAIPRVTFFEDFLGQIRKLKPSLGHHKF